MAKTNPETIITNRVRQKLESLGAIFIKISDSYTRGIPDALMAVTRMVLIEFKVDRTIRDTKFRSWKSLGLSGAQDHFIRQFLQRDPTSACVVTDNVSGTKLRLWHPVDQHDERNPEYYVLAAGLDEVYEWLS